MNEYRLSILNGFHLEGPRGLSHHVRPLDRIVIGVIATHAVPKPRTSIADVIWGANKDVESVKHCLAQCVYRLRKSWPGLLATSADGTLCIGTGVTVDFNELTSRATRSETAAKLERPISVLADIASPSADYEHWRDGKTAQLRTVAYDAVRASVRKAALEHDWPSVLDVGGKASMHGPLCDEIASALVRAAIATSSERSALNLLRERISAEWPYADYALQQIQAHWRQLPRTLVARNTEQAHTVILVGRVRELSLLTHHAYSARPSPQLITVSGERGIGKTRLVQELAVGMPQTARVLHTNCYPTRSRLPYAAILSLMKENLSQEDRLSLGPENRRILAKLLLPRKRQIGRRNVSTDRALRRRAQILSAFAEALRLLSETRRLVIILDDAQWLDLASAGLFSDLMNIKDSALHTLIVVRRSGDEGAGAASLLESELERFRTLRLDVRPLSQIDSAELAKRLVRGSDDGAVELISASGCGNPLIMTELASAACRGDSAGQPLPIPSEIVDHRLRGLQSGEKRILSIIVLAGRPIQLNTLSWISRFDDLATGFALAELESRGLALQLADGSGYIPGNDLVASRCGSLIPPSLRKFLHRLLADAAELEGQSATTIADHLIRADAGRRSARAALVAAKECLAIGAYEAAMYFIEAATETLRGTERFARMVRLYCEKLIEIGRLERVATLLEGKGNEIGLRDLSLYVNIQKQLNTGETPIGELLDQVKNLYARGPQWLASVALLTDFLGTSAEIAAYAHDRVFLQVLLDRLVEMAQTEQNVARAVEQAALASRLACLSNGAVDPVILAERCAEIAKDCQDRPTILRVLLAQASAKWYAGGLQQAYETYCRAFDLCEDAGLEYFRWRVQVERSAVLIDLGDPQRAIRELAPTLAGCSDRERAYALANLGAAAFERADARLLENVADRLFEINDRMSIPWIEVVALSYRGYGLLLANKVADSHRCAHTIAETLARHNGLALNEPSYTIIFCARAFEASVGSEDAVVALRRWVSQEVALSAAAKIRLRLEEARLLSSTSMKDGLCAAAEASQAAERTGAGSLVLTAEWLVRQLRIGRRVGWRRLAEVQAGASFSP